jgi:heptaprenyl diphosphate synthase
MPISRWGTGYEAPRPPVYFGPVTPTAPESEPVCVIDARPRVENALHAAVAASDPFLTEVAGHLIPAGGKRLRPLFATAAFACARAAGDPVSQDAIRGGVAVELVHLGSLYHDDVIDEAPTRRTVESVNARWGNLTAIVAGDFLLARASELAASLGTEVAGLLAATIGRLCEGEIGELRAAFNVDRTRASYLESISGKTASLFATACRIGAIVAELPRDQIDALTTFGESYGMAFQIVDDVLDLTSTEAELGKPAGHDLVEGVYTLPVLLTLAAPEGAELADLLGRPLEGGELDKAMALVRSGGGVAQAMELARNYVEEGISALGPLVATEAGAWLATTARQLLVRLSPGV